MNMANNPERIDLPNGLIWQSFDEMKNDGEVVNKEDRVVCFLTRHQATQLAAAMSVSNLSQRIATLENAITRMKHLCNAGLAGGGLWGPAHIKMLRDEVIALSQAKDGK
jgi:uncharacterized small protein (DUF1192 family)